MDHPHTHMTLTAGHAAMLAELAIKKYTNRLILDGHLKRPDSYITAEEATVIWVTDAITETARMANGHG